MSEVDIDRLKQRYRDLETRIAALEKLIAPLEEQRCHVGAHKDIEERLNALEGLHGDELAANRVGHIEEYPE